MPLRLGVPALVANGFSFQAPTSQLPGAPLPASRILDPNGNVLRSFGPRLAGPPALSKFATTLAAGLDNVTLVCGPADSVTAGIATGASAKWPVLLAQAWAAKYPNLNVTVDLWDDGSQSYVGGANQLVVQTGQAGPLLHIYIAALGGTSFEYWMRPDRIDTAITALGPDAVIVSLGKNEGGLTATQSLWRFNALIARIRARSPQAEIAHAIQNPNGSGASVPNQIDELRPKILENARQMGCDVIDACQVFRNVPGGATPSGTYLQGDSIHPTVGSGNTGQQLFADTVSEAVRFEPGSPPRTFPAPPTHVSIPCPLSNADFQDWGSSGPSGWTLSNVTATQDATHADDDQAFGFRMQATAGGSTVSALQDAPASFLAEAKGRWVCATALVYAPNTQTANNARIKIDDGTTTYQSQWLSTQAFGSTGFLLITAFGQVGAGASRVRLTLWGDTSTTGSCDITWGKVWMGLGTLPRKLGRDSRVSRLATLGDASTRIAKLRAGTLTVLRESLPDAQVTSASQAMTSGTLIGANVPVLQAESYDHVAFKSGATPATFGTNADGHWWLAVYDDTGTLVTQTADQGTTAIAGTTTFQIALLATVTPTHDAMYWTALMVYVGTGGSPAVCSLLGTNIIAAPSVIPGAARTSGATSNAGQTSGVAPGSLGALSNTGVCPYFALYK